MQQTVTGKAYKGMGMEGLTAKWYASVTHNSLDEFRKLAQRIAGETSEGTDILEVAPGPGYLAIELAKLGGHQITGLDVSHTFVKIAREKAAQAGVQVDFREGNAAAMPFGDECFDFVVCRAAFKNFSQPIEALREMYRVLRPGGRALIIDLRKDVSKESVGEAVDAMGLSRMNTVLTKMIFRSTLLKRAYTRNQFEQFLSRTKFEVVGIKEDLIGLELALARPKRG